MWKQPAATIDELDAIAADAIATLGSSHLMVDLDDDRPVYEPDSPTRGSTSSPSRRTPMLMLEGDLDPNSRPVQADVMELMFDGEDQRYVRIPWGGHSLASPTTAGYDCALAMVVEFLQQPTEPITDCRPEIVPIDFATAGGAALGLLGTPDPWGG